MNIHAVSLKQRVMIYNVTNTAGESIGASDYPVIRNMLPYLIEKTSSWEANRFSVNPNITRISWNPKVHYHAYKKPPPAPVLDHINQFSAPTSHFLKIHFNIILPSTPGSSKWYLSPSFPNQNPVCTSPHTCYLPTPSHILESEPYLIPYSLEDWRTAVL